MTEILVALAIVATLVGIAAPRLGALHDRAVVRTAAAELGALLATTRQAAMLRSAPAMLVLDRSRASATVIIGTDTIASRPLAERAAGLRLTATRDTIRYGPSGRGHGASNATIVVSKGAAGDTLWVSRLGRVRR
jgi:Tfp pilus assembly protein FimT